MSTRQNKRPYLGALLGCTLALLAAPLEAQEPAPLDDRALAEELGKAKQSLEQEIARKSALSEQLRDLPNAQLVLEQMLARDVRALYRLRRGGLLPLAGGIEALVTHASRVSHLERMAQRTMHELTRTRERSASLAKEVIELDQTLSATERHLQAIEHTRQSLAAEAAARAALEAQAQAATRAERQDSSAQVSYGLTVVGAGSSQGELESLSTQRGRLALPVAGAASIQGAESSEAGSKALLFEGRSGVSVRAAANGRVLSVEPSESGTLVVIEHGGGYRTRYAGLASSDVESGDSVSKSARIGSVGSAPVYFEVRRGSRCLDARSFLGL